MNKSAQSFFNGKKIWITGHNGMLGSAMVRSFKDEDVNLLLTSRQDLDLTNQSAVEEWVLNNKPDYIFHIGAKVGGIQANSQMPADFLYNNIMIQSNVINAAHRAGVKKLLFVASNCTYPVNASQPISEEALMTGPLEQNIRFYGIAKIAGIEMCRAYRKQHGSNFISIIPPNLYGPGDNYHPQHGHVVAGIMRRAHEAKTLNNAELTVWGDGTARRELLHVDDLASAMKFLMISDSEYDLYNIGSGHDLSIKELATLIAEVTGFKGKIVFDTSKPNGTMRKLLCSKRINEIGWKPSFTERDGLLNAYSDFLKRINSTEFDPRI